MKRIFRVVKDRNYTTIHNGFLNCKSLSWGAKGLFAYILSKPDHWNINLNELCTHSTNGISSTRGFYKELVDAGYILKVNSRQAGKFVTHYQIFEKPELNPTFPPQEKHEDQSLFEIAVDLLIDKQNFKHGKTSTENRASETALGEPTTVDLTVLNTELVSTKKESTNKINTQYINSENQKELIDRILPVDKFISESEKVFQRYYDLYLGGQKFFNTDIWILQSLHNLTGGNIEIIQEKLLYGWKEDKYFGVEGHNIAPTPKLLDKHFNRFVKKPNFKIPKPESQIIANAIEASFEGKFIPAKDISNYKHEKDLVQGYPVRWLKEVWGLSESFIRNESLMQSWIEEYEADIKRQIHATNRLEKVGMEA
ncbi:MAG: hypothetical protein O9346_01865 [Leptospiraceae bacterium]|jgi:hypothetical protein|nr:hypothetical protein [Leptospiraceae bacterium]